MNFADNIQKVFDRATDTDQIAGRLWYRAAREIAHQVGNGDVYRGAGIIAALSPQIAWKENVRLAIEGSRKRKFFGQFKNNTKKAERILKGENPETVLGGPKTRAFYFNIVTGGDTKHVCVDRHALSIALGRDATEKERKRLSKLNSYNTIAEAYQVVAERTGFRVADVQAITWVAWRREKGITD